MKGSQTQGRETGDPPGPSGVQVRRGQTEEMRRSRKTLHYQRKRHSLVPPGAGDIFAKPSGLPACKHSQQVDFVSVLHDLF